MYLTYEEYQALGGTLDATTFAEYEFDAQKVIDYYTFDRLKQDTVFSEAIKRLVFKLVSVLQTKDAALTAHGSSPAVTQQSNDGVTVQYNAMNAFDAYNVLKTEQGATIRQYLSGETNQAGEVLLYRGVY